MGAAVRVEVEVPGLAAALAARGVTIDPDAAACLTDVAGGGAGAPLILLVAEAGAVAAALDAGADDAVPIGAGAEEIAARVAARLRAATPPLGIGELLIDRIARRVTRAGKALTLLPREYALLLHLAQRAGEPVPRAELLQAIWGLGFDPGTNVVAVHVSRLRAKLDRGFATPMLHTDTGIGYRLALA